MVIFNENGWQTEDMVLVNYGIYNWTGLFGQSGVEVVSADSSSVVTVSGKTICTVGKIRVYSMTGIVVADGMDRVDISEAGTYIVVTDSGAVKVSLK